jgi:hypothetical protein
MIWVLMGLQEGPVFGQERAGQSVQLLPKFLQSLVLLLLLPCNLLAVIVDVDIHPVIHHLCHVFFSDKRILKDLEVMGRELARENLVSNAIQECQNSLKNSHLLFSLTCTPSLLVSINPPLPSSFIVRE